MGDLNHRRRDVEAYEVLFGVLLGEKFNDRARATAHVEHVIEGITLELCQHGRIVVLAYLVNARMIGLIDLRRLGELPDRELLVLFGCHRLLLLRKNVILE